MKQTLLLIISIFIVTYCSGQIYPAQCDSFKTEIEQAANAKNVLIKKEFIDLDKIKRVNFRFIKVYNYETKTTTKGLYIETKSGRYKKTHYLDSAEIVAFYKNLISLDSNIRKPNFETVFVIYSKDNFKIDVKCDDWTGESRKYIFLNKKKNKRKGKRLNENKFKQLIAVFANAKALLQ